MSFVSSTDSIMIKPNSGSSGSSGTITLDTNNSSGNGNIYLKSNGTTGSINLDASSTIIAGACTFNTTPISTTVQPLSTDSSTKIPTTAWVQSAISVNNAYPAKDAYPALNPYSSGVKAVSTWNTRTTPNNNNLYSICWSPELLLFVAVGSTGNSSTITTSPDGITWTLRSAPNANIIWNSVCWSPQLSRFVAVAASGVGNRVMTSNDGIIWASKTSAADNGWIYVCWADKLSLFVALSVDGAKRVMTSKNGETWDLNTDSTPNTNIWSSIVWCYELSIFVAVSLSSSLGDYNVMTSLDGISWDIQVTPNNTSLTSVCWSPQLKIFVAVGIAGNTVITSPDGKTWTSRISAAVYAWESVCWSPQLGVFVAVASRGSLDSIMSSPDGINWNLRIGPTDNIYRNICWSPELGIFAAVSSTGSLNRVITSALAGRPPTNYNVFNSSSNNIDNNGNWDIKARNLNLRNGLIQGRSDGLDYTNENYDIYVGYCLFSKLDPAESFVNTTETKMTPSRTLPAGVYIISGVVTFAKQDSTYATANPFTVKWSATGGIVPDTSDREIVMSTTAGSGLIIGLPTTYFIVTNILGGAVSPVYSFTVATNPGNTATVNYQITIIRVA